MLLNLFAKRVASQEIDHPIAQATVQGRDAAQRVSQLFDSRRSGADGHESRQRIALQSRVT